MLNSSLCEHSGAYILVSGAIEVPKEQQQPQTIEKI